MKKNILNKLFICISLLLLALSVKGVGISPNDNNLNTPKLIEQGPFELSPERGRFALTYSLVENQSFSYSLPVAEFSTPDLGYLKGKFVSIFAPGVSLLAIPGYVIGKAFGGSQVGAFSIVALIAFFNAVLIRNISLRLGAHPAAAILSAMTFLFATPAFAYATTLYQHHISVLLLLLSISFILNDKRKLFNVTLVWLFLGLSVLVDYPNLIIFFPLGVMALLGTFEKSESKGVITYNLNLTRLFTLTGLIIPIALLLLYNQLAFGNPFQISGALPTVSAFNNGQPVVPDLNAASISSFDSGANNQAISGFFQLRNLIPGLKIHLISPDRGIIFYAPVILFGLFGIGALRKRKGLLSITLLMVGLVNLLIYSMWGDPWGGWAFGSRYLIPLYAILSIFLSAAITQLKNKFIFIVPFALILIYSVFINTAGALTSNANPPKAEAINLAAQYGLKPEYTFTRNINLLKNNQSKSFIFQQYASSSFKAYQYFTAIFLVLVITNGVLVLSLSKIKYLDILLTLRNIMKEYKRSFKKGIIKKEAL